MPKPREPPLPMPENDGQWESEYAQWCQEQDDADEINRMLREADDGSQ